MNYVKKKIVLLVSELLPTALQKIYI